MLIFDCCFSQSVIPKSCIHSVHSHPLTFNIFMKTQSLEFFVQTMHKLPPSFLYHLTEEGHCCSKLFQHTINFVRLLVRVTLEKREGACALFVQKTPDMFTNLPSARKTLKHKVLGQKDWPLIKKVYTAISMTHASTLYDVSLPFEVGSSLTET